MTRIPTFSLCVLLPFLLAPAHAQTTSVIVQKGDAAPDGNGSFSHFFAPALNDAGQVAFVAGLTDTSGEDRDELGIFRGDRATHPTQIVRLGQAAPDGNGTFSRFASNSPALNEAGQVAFFSALTGTSGMPRDNSGIFLGDGSTGPTRIVRLGQAAPDGSGRFLTLIGLPAINAAGQAGFLGVLHDEASGELRSHYGVFRGDEVTGPTWIARINSGAPNNSVRSFPAINDAGQVAFDAHFDGASDSSGMYRGDGVTGLTQIARAGQAAPDGNGTFSAHSFRNPALNELGQTAFLARLDDTSGGLSDNHGIFRGDGVTNLTQIARAGQAPPDGNGTFSGFGFGDPALNNDGQVAFLATLTGTTGGFSGHSGIFRGDGLTSLTQIARAGQAAPGGSGELLGFDDPALNDAGQVAFLANLPGRSSREGRSVGIFFHDDALGLLKVARSGDVLLGSTIINLHFQSSEANSSNERSGLNELGQVAYAYDLADGNSGVAIWTLTVPEPSPVALLTLAGLTLFGRRTADR
jgi:hypothetical protein